MRSYLMQHPLHYIVSANKNVAYVVQTFTLHPGVLANENVAKAVSLLHYVPCLNQ